jgi:hypothetical protein
MPSKHAASHPSADSSVANTQRHTTHLKVFCKRLGLHYTRLLNDRKRDYKRPHRKQSISPQQAKHHPPKSDENIFRKPNAAEVGLRPQLMLRSKLPLGFLRGIRGSRTKPFGSEGPNQGIMSPFLEVLHGVALQRKNKNISSIFSRYVSGDNCNRLQRSAPLHRTISYQNSH